MAAKCVLRLALALLPGREAALAASATPEGSVRLAGGNTDAGRVEVFYGGRWGWICLGGSQESTGLQGWGKAAAEVVCQQLGLRTGIGTMRMANGRSSDVLPIVAAECNGTEASILDCQIQQSEGSAAEACLEQAALPAGAGVRCSNFVAEDQPQISLSGNAPESLLTDASQQVVCNSEPEATSDNATGNSLPTFACTVKEHATENVQEASCPAGSRGCESDSSTVARDAPTPFAAEVALEAFVFKPPMEGHLQAAEEKRRQVLAAQRPGLLRAAAEGGAKWSSIGIELSPEASNQSVDKEDQVAAMRSAYFSPVARLLFDLDADVIGLRGRKSEPRGVAGALEPAAAEIFSTLEDRGAAELGDMRLSDELQQEALDALGEKAFGEKLAAVRTPLPLLEKWLQENTTMSSAIAAYFGGHAVLHGYKVVHLPSKLTPKEFISAHWHHDRAGRRLKMFILLNDVDPVEGHPTQVALGSHRLSYYWHEEFEQSRYDNSYVQREFETVRLAGARGTGYIFDTNTIHKGTPEGSQGRNVIVVEYHQAAKCGLIARLGLNIPCPSGDQKALNWYFSMD